MHSTRKDSPLPAAAPRPATQALDARLHLQWSRWCAGLSPLSLGLAAADWAWHLGSAPGRQLELAQQALGGSQSAKQTGHAAGSGGGHGADARFTDPAWAQWPYAAWRDGFTACQAWWQAATQVEGVREPHRQKVAFFARQWLDALSPANHLFTNPEVWARAQATGGNSLREGLRLLLQDLQVPVAPAEGAALPPLEFEVGRDVATTPGEVVFRNHLIELIQYRPSTDQVAPEPLLIVPSCIMKYYILDLSPHNSLVRYLVDQGFTVFTISWRNPDAADRDLGINDYLLQGVLAAMAAVGRQTGAARLHALGYCLGGTFLAMVAALLGRLQRSSNAAGRSRKGRAPGTEPVASGEPLALPEGLPALATASLLAAQTDFSEPGELGVFIDPDQVAVLQQAMAEAGYFSGRQMGGSFQFLHARDLLWSRQMRRYLLGEADAPFDLMSWNADTTRLPARMHGEYLESFFLHNALARGQWRFGATPVALGDIAAPLLVVATARDHVSPWPSVYKIHQQTEVPVRFVLAAGGHNAGIVSEPGHAGRSHQVGDRAAGQAWTAPEDWAAATPVTPGSWWPVLSDWLRQHAGAPVAPPAMGPSLGAAPGSYVGVRYAD